MAAPYLSSKTEALSSQTPVSPSHARAAQIPLQNFVLPTFPPEAFSSGTSPPSPPLPSLLILSCSPNSLTPPLLTRLGLTALTLTSDIPLAEYTSLLTQPFSIPELPISITNLTLELFSLGYPPSFLTSLSHHLSPLTSLTLYSQLFAGTTSSSHTDAISFIKAQTQLKELHLLDIFAPKTVFADLLAALGAEVRFLEISYTFRHEDKEFLNSIPGAEIIRGLKAGLLGLSAVITAPEISEEDGNGDGEVGMRPIPGEGGALVKKLWGMGENLVVLDVSMFEISVSDLQGILEACKRVRVLCVSVALESGWGELMAIFGREGRGTGIERLEVVGVPSVQLVERLKGGGELVVEEGELDALGVRCTGLKSLKVSVLRTRGEEWVREGNGWVKKS